MSLAARCISALSDQGVEITPAEAKLLQDDIEYVGNYAEREGIPLEEAVEISVQSRRADIKKAKAVMERNQLLNFEAYSKAKSFIDANYADDPAMGIQVLLTGSQVNRKGSKNAVSVSQAALADRYLSTLMQLLNDADVFDYAKPNMFGPKGSNDANIQLALIALDRSKPDTQALAKLPKEAKKVAEIILGVQDQARIDANDYGAVIGKLDGRGMRRGHDQFKITNAGEKDYSDFLMENLDFGRTIVPEENRESFVKSRFIEFSTGVHIKGTAGSNTSIKNPSVIKGMGNMGKSMSHERVLHFKSAEAEVEYHDKFGRGGVIESVIFDLERHAQQTGLMKVLGPNAETNFDGLMNHYGLQAKRESAEAYGNFAKWSKNLKEHNWPMVTGDLFVAHNAMAAKVNQAWRSLNHMQLLGSAVFSAVADIPLYGSEVRHTGGNMFSGMSEAIAGLTSGKTSAQKREILSAIGYISDGMRGTAVTRFDVDNIDPGAVSRMTQLYFKFNMLTPWTDKLRSTFILSRSNELAGMAGQSFGDMHNGWQRMLNQFDITSDEWDVIRKADIKLADGKQYLTPESVANLSDDVFKAYLDKTDPGWSKISDDGQKAKIRKSRELIRTNFESYFHNRARVAVIEPDSGSRAFMLRGSKAGSVDGEILRHVGFLKGFSIGVARQVLGRELYGTSSTIHRGAKGIGGALKEPGVALNTSSLILTNMAFGYAAMSIKDLVKGREPRDPTDPRTVIAAMLQGGALGIYGDLLFGELKNRYGGSAISTLLGPSIADVDTLFDLFNRAKTGDDAAGTALKHLLNNVPGTGLFYTKWAWDYMITYNMMEMASPGALKRMEANLMKNTEQEYFVKPSSVVPYGGGMPNF